MLVSVIQNLNDNFSLHILFVVLISCLANHSDLILKHNGIECMLDVMQAGNVELQAATASALGNLASREDVRFKKFLILLKIFLMFSYIVLNYSHLIRSVLKKPSVVAIFLQQLETENVVVQGECMRILANLCASGNNCEISTI